MKESGILLHISSLSTDYGIGDLGPAAHRFADYLKESGYSYWQILPLNHPGRCNSPYNPISAFAWNPYLISPELLYRDGLLKESSLRPLPRAGQVDYPKVIKLKDPMLKEAARTYLKTHDIDIYISRNADHLKPYLSFVELTNVYGHDRWQEWPRHHRNYSQQLFDELAERDRLRETAALQVIFKDQLRLWKDKLNSNGLKSIGDLPLYLSYGSADVWANQELFDLDEEGRRQSVAGVPPDVFSESGQIWGNPIYKWDKLREENFSLFKKRFEQIFDYIDLLRLDHFIGYVNYWKIPSTDGLLPESAAEGAWVRALPEQFFAQIAEDIDMRRFIAEDLGILNEDVCNLRDQLGLPGMIILQFCFDEGIPDVQSFPSERFIYTGTHDNDTTVGWWKSLDVNSPARSNLKAFCEQHLAQVQDINEHNIHQIMNKIAEISGCERRIIPMQDILGLDEKARMNIPGTALHNWQWRMDEEPSTVSRSK